MKASQIAVGVIAILVLLGFGFWIGRHTGAKSAQITETVVIEKVRQIAKIATIEHHIADIVTFEEQSPWPIFGKDKKALVIARGKVLAGFDLKKPITCRVQSTGTNTTVELRLPKPEIMAVDPSYEYYDLQNLTKDQNQWLLGKAKRTMVVAAQKAGIFEDAERSLALFLGGLFPTVRFSITFGEIPYTGPSSLGEWNPEMGGPNQQSEGIRR
jgi:hypothetical protein